MAVQVNPIAPSLPATTAIQDPAVRQFANAVADALRASNSPEGSVKALVEALEAVGKGSQVSPVFGLNGTPQGVSEIYKSRLYEALKSPVAQIVQREGLGSAEALEVIEDNNTVIVNALNAMWATVGASGVFTEDGKNIVANWTTAQAEKWSQIEAEVLSAGGQTIRAALLQESQTRANLEGDVYASYTLRVDANGNIAGFGLAADENSSEFIVRADKFAVVTDIGGTPHVPFAIGPSGAEFTGLTNWANVTGTGKPQDNATEGASFGEKQFGPALSLVVSGGTLSGRTFTHTAGTGWGLAGFYSTNSFSGSAYAEYRVTKDSNCFIGLDGNPSQDHNWPNIDYGLHQQNGTFALHVYESGAGPVNLGTCAIDDLLSVEYAGTTVTYRKNGVALRAVGTTAGRTFFLDGATYQTGDALADIIFAASNPGVTGNNITGKITSGNVTTYIANAAIGNAQIGGDIWSSNHSAGSAGWRIYRSGSAEFLNITARGDIQASSLTANSVNTSNINGEAVTAIRFASSTSSQTISNATWTSVLSYASFPANGGGVLIMVMCGLNDSVTGGGTSIRVVKNGSTVLGQLQALTYLNPSMEERDVMGETVNQIFYDSSPGTSPTYEIQVYKKTRFSSFTYNAPRKMVLMTAKR